MNIPLNRINISLSKAGAERVKLSAVFCCVMSWDLIWFMDLYPLFVNNHMDMHSFPIRERATAGMSVGNNVQNVALTVCVLLSPASCFLPPTITLYSEYPNQNLVPLLAV